MALDRTKVLEAAQKHLAKGAYDKAIAEYQKLVKDDPNDVRTWLKIGDLFTRKGQKAEATQTYGRVAETYAKQGFFLKAVAVYKQILKLDPDIIDVQLKLGEMYEQLALISDALATYEQVAATYAKQGSSEKALATLQRMVDLDPENIPVRIKYAESLSKANKVHEAADAFEGGAKLLQAQGRIDDYMKVAERLLFHRPEDVKLARELAELYLERRDAKRALSKLQVCFKSDPRDVKTLELLGDAFLGLEQKTKAISVFREIARIHLDGANKKERARILHRILELDPNDAEARAGLDGSSQVALPPEKPKQTRLPPGPRVVSPPSAFVGAPKNARADVINPSIPKAAPAPKFDLPAAPPMPEGPEDDLVISDDAIDTGMVTLPEALPDAQLGLATGELNITTGEISAPQPENNPIIQRLLAECEVFQRYGLRAKVIDQLQRVLSMAPNHVLARERLRDAYLDAGRDSEAIAELHILANMFLDHEPDVAIQYYDQILALDPNDATAGERLRNLGGAPSPPVERRPTQIYQPHEDDLILPDDFGEEPGPSGPSYETEASDDEELEEVDELEEIDAEPEDSQEMPVAAARRAPLEEADEADIVNDPFPDEDTADGELDFDDDTDASKDSEPPAPARASQRPRVATPDLIRQASERPGPKSTPPAAAEEIDYLAPMSPEEFEAGPVASARPPSAPRASAAELEEVLDEADFFAAQGLYAEARDALADMAISHPNHPLIEDKLVEIDELEANAKKASIAPDEAAPDESFQLAEKLAAELSPVTPMEEGANDQIDVEQVFAAFKKGVEEQIGLEDSDTHFDLGIAYKEMGLLDDAMKEFDISMSNPQRECIAHTMIGLCHMEKGAYAEAISRFKKGLYCDTKTEREELGLYYELGIAYELLKDPKEALYYYQKVQKRDGTFRNIGQKLKELTAPKTSAAPPNIATDDVDSAFDDLMDDVKK